MANDKAPKTWQYKEIKGFLSEKQLAEHKLLYEGYVKKINEIWSKAGSADKSLANGTYSDLRALKVEETFALNAIKLHEGYFSNIQNSKPITGKIAEWITHDFGNFEKWAEEFKALGLCARGWVVLAFDIEEQKLRNIICDAHNQGGIWGCVPLLILDVYEHAYFMDYATARKKYTEAFMQNLDWDFVNSLIEKYKLTQFRK
ncbi:superoxide dismutase [Candidatus Woesearchaeota archaeon]|nr:superoxide dismutase [Candidatus Woesearchaeota archaeon]